MISDNDQDVRELFHDPRLPDVDVTDKVMRKLYAEQNIKERFRMKHKVKLLVVAGALLTVSTGLAAVKYQSLENKQGNVVYQFKPLQEAGYHYEEEDRQRLIMSRDLGEKLLKEGSAALFYIAEHNPNNELDVRFKPFSFTDASALRAKLSNTPVTVLEKLQGGYGFERGEAFFQPEYSVNPPDPEEKAAMAEKLKQEAKASNNEYAMMPVELSDELLHVHAVYKNGNQAVNVTVVNFNGDESAYTAYMDENIGFSQEKIAVKDVDMIYTKYTNGGGSLVWVDENSETGQKYGYTIESGAKEIGKEELIQIAESYLK